jgi:hypothetical protein
MPDAAAACAHCGARLGEPVAPAHGSHLAAAPHAVSAPLQPVAAPPQHAAAPGAQAKSASPAGMNRRVLLGLALIVVAGGGFTLKMLMASSSPAVPVQSRVPTTTRPPAQSATAPKPVPAGPTWKRADRDWLWNPRRGAAFELPSVNRVAIWQGQVRPMLVVRCESGRMQTFVYTASAMQMEMQDENHTVRFRFDEESEQTERWADDSDHSALLAPDAVGFARRLTTARTLRFSYSPHNAGTAVAEFHVGGLGDLIQSTAKQCGCKQ